MLDRNLPDADKRGEVIEEIGKDYVSLRLPVIKDYISHDLYGLGETMLLSGPIIMGFAETSLYACAHAIYGKDVVALIINCNISFLRMTGSEDLVSTARILEKGKSVARIHATICTINYKEPVAVVESSYSIKEV